MKYIIKKQALITYLEVVVKVQWVAEKTWLVVETKTRKEAEKEI